MIRKIISAKSLNLVGVVVTQITVVTIFSFVNQTYTCVLYQIYAT